MYENMTADYIEKRMLDRISADLDKREGSIVYDATAPASIEFAEAYIMARVILKQTFATTADRAFLLLRAAEYNVYPYEATYAQVKAQFNQAVSLGTRFNQGSLNFTVTALLADTDHTYKLQCETAGIIGNSCLGSILPIETISGLTSAAITSVLVPGEDEEDTETFRARYIETIKSKAYGGNGADYKEKVMAIAGIGGVKVYRCWNGGGTVKLVILSSDYSIPSAELITLVQNTMDPDPQGKGYGWAPIGHTVTTAAATTVTINVTASLLVKSGYSVADMQAPVEKVIAEYLEKQRMQWCKDDDKTQLIIRTAVISADALEITNMLDVTDVTVNGHTDRLFLNTDEVPVLGTVTLKEG